MHFTANNCLPVHNRRAPVLFPVACLSAVLTLVAAGCAGAPVYRTNPDWPQRKGSIKTIGLLPPMISVYEEQFRYGLNQVVLHDDWTREAADAVRNAFIEESSARHLPVKVIDGDDRDWTDLLDLYVAVDLSITRHVWEDHGLFYRDAGVIHTPPLPYDNLKDMEPFPEKARTFDYSLGDARETMERQQVDAAWIISGFNLLPTAGAQARDVADYFFSTIGSLAGSPTNPSVMRKLEIRAALVDQSGQIVFYAILDDSNVPGEEGAKEDLRDPGLARRYVRALLSAYLKAAQ